mgnify:CR=1 FL=1
MKEMWINYQQDVLKKMIRSPTPESSYLDFFIFKTWARSNLDVYPFIDLFSLVPSPAQEHDFIYEILENY